MNVGELIMELSKYPPDLPVVLSQDAEGNGFGELVEAGESMWLDEDDGQTYPTPEEVSAPGSRFDPEDDFPPEEAVRAVVLWPV